MVNPFTAVSQAEYDALQADLDQATSELGDVKREVSALRIELQREQENAGRLTELAARAVQSVDILRQALIRRAAVSSPRPREMR